MINTFCQNPTYENFKILPASIKKLFYEYSKKNSKQIRNKKLAESIIAYYEDYDKHLGFPVNDWCKFYKINTEFPYEMCITKSGLFLYRGMKQQFSTVNQYPTYYALDVGNANQYLPSTKKGYLNIYKTTKYMTLFRLDSLVNINMLLKENFEEKKTYLLIKSLFYNPLLGERMKVDKKLHDSIIAQSETENTPIQFKKLIRYSVFKQDRLFAEWICKKGFDGFSAGIMKMYHFMNITNSFPEEIVICNSQNFVELIKEIHMKKQKNRILLQQIIQNETKYY